MAEIPLTQGKIALVDDADVPLVGGYSWSAARRPHTCYAQTFVSVGGKRTILLMHRLILGLKPGDPGCDHKDGDGLNNRRLNLRQATKSQNAANSFGRTSHRRSRYKGVFWSKEPDLTAGRWRAYTSVNGKRLRRYAPTELEAAVEYNKMALEHFGEFARLNLVPCSWPERV